MEDPLDQLESQLHELHVSRRERGAVQQVDALRELIGKARAILLQDRRPHGSWEMHELRDAERALEVGWLHLCAACIDKAIAVARIPRDDYLHGFSYSSETKAKE